ncbi:FUSC family protein [Bordetella pertussis]
MTLIGIWLAPNMAAHSYWVLLTIVIIMKPGFALTRQRNGWRLMGTLVGCILALILFTLTNNPTILFAVLLGACIMGNSLVQLNYMASAIFNTLFVVLVFHFVAPGTVSLEVIGEQAMDTALGCALALICSYVLPWWEARYMKPLARAASRANREYLRAGLRYIEAMRQPAPGGAAARRRARKRPRPASAPTPTPTWPGLAWPGLAAGPQERAYRVQQFRRGVLSHDERADAAPGERARIQ